MLRNEESLEENLIEPGSYRRGSNRTLNSPHYSPGGYEGDNMRKERESFSYLSHKQKSNATAKLYVSNFPSLKILMFL